MQCVRPVECNVPQALPPLLACLLVCARRRAGAPCMQAFFVVRCEAGPAPTCSLPAGAPPRRLSTSASHRRTHTSALPTLLLLLKRTSAVPPLACTQVTHRGIWALVEASPHMQHINIGEPACPPACRPAKTCLPPNMPASSAPNHTHAPSLSRPLLAARQASAGWCVWKACARWSSGAACACRPATTSTAEAGRYCWRALGGRRACHH